jgi:FKBP-type peptidyl-prolyl cis-trans isomerase
MILRFLIRVLPVVLVLLACNKVSYRKTTGGLPYRIIKGKDTLSIRKGNFVKFYITQKINDSVFYSNFGKMPAYMPVGEERPYDLTEIWKYMKRGDSAVIKASMDTFIKREPQNPDFVSGKFKKGDEVTFYLKVLDVFENDSLYQIDFNKTMVQFEPQRKQEEAEFRARMMEDMKKMREKEDLDLEQSGEMAAGIKAMEAYLQSKKINAQKVGKATFVEMTRPGTGAPAVEGKYLTVKYEGRLLRNDSVFDANTFPLQLGSGQVIRGWDEGLTAFREGGAGVLYIPGFRAYGKNPPQGSGFQKDDALIFKVELLAVSDTMPTRQGLAPHQ